MIVWTDETRRGAIAQQLDLIARRAVPMAVVDYGLDWQRTGASARYGVRDMRHVAIYQLNVVALNAAAQSEQPRRVIVRPLERGPRLGPLGERVTRLGAKQR